MFPTSLGFIKLKEHKFKYNFLDSAYPEDERVTSVYDVPILASMKNCVTPVSCLIMPGSYYLFVFPLCLVRVFKLLTIVLYI